MKVIKEYTKMFTCINDTKKGLKILYETIYSKKSQKGIKY